MRKEIGSIFPLSDFVISEAEKSKNCFPNDKLYYSLCREALYDIAVSLSETNRQVLIPAYTCQTVITPFEEAGWNCQYYSIQKNLRIDVVHLKKLVEEYNPSVVVTHPYFGMDLNGIEEETLQSIHDKDIKVVLDLTQCVFSLRNTSFADYVMGSYRKWFPIPDGGYLIEKGNHNIMQPQDENAEFTEREVAAMYLRGQYFGNGEQRTKDISIRLSKTADHIAERGISPHKMSKIAFNLYSREDVDYNKKCRFENYTYLYENIRESERVSKVCHDINEVTTAPLYFTIYVKDRPTLQRLLAQDSIYAPVIWPVEDERVLISDVVIYIYEHLLAIPCDQRYNEEDMQRVLDIINKY